VLPTNYFEALDLLVAYHIDESALRKAYQQKSRELHPDYYTQASEAEQQRALALSAYVNVAYKTLSKSEARLEYLLKHFGLLQAENKVALPQSFLFEMMELNEQLSELESQEEEGARAKLKHTVETQQAELMQEAGTHLLAFDAEKDTEKRRELLQPVLDIYLRNKYLQRLLERLEPANA
jgi:molecular chaperone HscB